MKNFLRPATIRARFEKSLSQMFSNEVEAYSKTLPIVREINLEYRQEHNIVTDEPLAEEHHGAIRVASKQEFRQIVALFNVMGMKPVGYYNLHEAAKLPIHSTAFRDVSEDGLKENRFRVFASLLIKEAVPKELLPIVDSAIARRDILSDGAKKMIDINKSQGSLTDKQADIFVAEAIKTFRREEEAVVSKSDYEKLLKANSVMADAVSFQKPHLNHMTLKVHDIDILHKRLQENAMETIPAVQGPPKMEVPPFLRQVSIVAQEEKYKFPDGKGGYEEGLHRARFGEYETKDGIALTPKGRALYDEALQATMKEVSDKDEKYQEVLQRNFSKFPKTKEEYRRQELAYFKYFPNKDYKGEKPKDWNDAVAKGAVGYKGVLYQDFLPVSAAGIFKSNTKEGGFIDSEETKGSKESFEKDIGTKVFDPYELYAKVESESVSETAKKLGIKYIRAIKIQ
ncbi:MAG: DUF1338 domain-containing protein [Alphaproteobacteria bacterium CG11_big_fil_rev_8_21_14_0_20_39_49]|nr:MAG: DUF1338 domain-containing protein [Alphaproteobacteria bacterium CG11_big_fil_rev_8_21_14_0_20_39_49]